VLGDLLRAPEPVPDLQTERALTRLQAARSDAGYLLLHRVRVLETALLQLRQRAITASDAGSSSSGNGAASTLVPATSIATPAAPASPAQPAAASRSFLRDAAVVTLGVVAGHAVWDGMSAPTEGDPGPLAHLSSLRD